VAPSGGQSGCQRAQALNARAVAVGQLSRAKSLANQAELLVSRASVLSGQPPQAALAGSQKPSTTISGNFSSYLAAWERYAHGLRACLRHSSQQLLEARHSKEVVDAQLDSMRILLEQCERQRDEALAVVDQLNTELQSVSDANARHAAVPRSGEPREDTDELTSRRSQRARINPTGTSTGRHAPFRSP
jgi:hypothetical protein